MTDDADHKKPRGFEPPPWEREQFEELARRRAAAAETAAAEAAVNTAVLKAQAPAQASAQEPTRAPAQDAAAEGGVGAPGEPETGPAPPGREGAPEEQPKADERVADAMLFDLSGQEGPTLAPLRRAGKVVAGLVGAIGVAILGLGVWTSAQAAAAEESVGVGTMGAAIIMIFGLLVVGMAGWTWVRASRSQGS
jgi:hypothetical protein